MNHSDIVTDKRTFYTYSHKGYKVMDKKTILIEMINSISDVDAIEYLYTIVTYLCQQQSVSDFETDPAVPYQV